MSAKIVQNTAATGYYINQFFIYRERTVDKKVVVEYLHRDGVWRSTTLSKDGKPTGWYQSIRLARNTLKDNE